MDFSIRVYNKTILLVAFCQHSLASIPNLIVAQIFE